MPKIPRQTMSKRRYEEHNVYDKRVVLKQHRSKLEFIDLLKNELSKICAQQLDHGYILLIRRLLDNLLQITEMDTLQRAQITPLVLPSPSHDLLRLQAFLSNTKPIVDADLMLNRYQQIAIFENNELRLRTFVDHLDLNEDRNVQGSLGPFLLPSLIKADERTMLRLLLDRGVNMEPDEPDMSLLTTACKLGNKEIVAMLLYYNADPWSPKDICPPFVVTKSPMWNAAYCGRDDIVDMLLDYTIDEGSMFPLDLLLFQMIRKSPVFPRLLRIPYVTFSVAEECIDLMWDMLPGLSYEYIDEMLRTIGTGADFRESLIERFDPSRHWKKHWRYFWDFYLQHGYFSDFLDVWYVLAEHKLGDHTMLELILDKIRRPLLDIFQLHSVLWQYRDESRSSLVFMADKIVLLLLTNNATLDNSTLEILCRPGDMFNFCRMIEVDCSEPVPRRYQCYATHSDKGTFYRDPLLRYSFSYFRFYFDFPNGKTITEVLSDPAYGISYDDALFYVQHSAHPILKKVADYYFSDCPILSDLVNSLPDVPLLAELARDAARKYVEKAFTIKNNLQFYLAVKKLKIGDSLQKVVLYEKTLYPANWGGYFIYPFDFK